LKLRVLWFGRPAASPYETAVEEYRRRVGRRWPAEDLPLKPTAAGRGEDPKKVLRTEADTVRRRVPDGWRLVVLDERGDELDSEAFAAMLGGAEDAGLPGVALVVGSDIGLDPLLRQSAHHRLSLGPMTLPHLLARLVVWEQLFRATSILGGGGYHRHRVQ
jgi:23S rRNA (pseudouridine1915-N3)-methyltransferase